MKLLQILTLFIVFINFSTAYCADIFWTGDGDGTSWGDANNWDTDTVPNDNDDVTIGSSFTVYLTQNYDNLMISSLTIETDATLNGGDKKLKLKSNGVVVTNNGTITNMAEFKTDIENSIVYNYGMISGTKIHAGKDETSYFYNYEGATVSAVTEVHIDGYFYNESTVKIFTGGKLKLHGGTLTGGGTIQADNVEIEDEDDRGVLLENQIFTTESGCDSGSADDITFSEKHGESGSFSEVANNITDTDGISINLDNVYVCTLNAQGAELPVELTSFEAETYNQYVAVYWTTATEENNAHFVVQRSIDTKKWENLSKIEGAGNSNVTLSYSFIDNTPLAGISHYRLYQIDFDGLSEYFPYITVDRGESFETFIRSFPSPAINTINIQSNIDGFKNQNFKIFNIIGKDVSSTINTFSSSHNLISLDISTLQKGIYFYKSRKQTVRFIKE